GDYFDYLVFSGNKLFVLTGDVTGHGVPAALIMAMSKSVVGTIARFNLTAQQILENLNQTIFENFVQKKLRLLMTLGAVFIDTDSHEAILYNFGHPFPFKKNSAGEIQMIMPSGGPLGSRGKLIGTPMPIKLEKGERLFFYTDGLVESLSMVESLGMDRQTNYFKIFENYLNQFKDFPIQEACRQILKQHPFFEIQKPQPDDFTIVIVERMQ
ncbi:serine/threonine-protein phosphatase, partial [bacterium]|nr:serine/threonine-protein phosphatase [bacterium]